MQETINWYFHSEISCFLETRYHFYYLGIKSEFIIISGLNELCPLEKLYRLTGKSNTLPGEPVTNPITIYTEWSVIYTFIQNRDKMINKMLFRFATVKLLLMFLLAGNANFAPAQVIRGTVVDSQTEDVVSFASVYFSGTTIGTVTGEDGKFELDISGQPLLPLTVSAVGYSSVTLDEFSADVPLKIYLTPRVYDIAPIEVSTSSLERERRANLRVFRNEFLGRTSYARRCEILNEHDITFNYGSDGDTLIAYALQPLQIRNNALGYIITFHLDRFEFYRKTSGALYTGTFIFREMAAGIGSMNQIVRRRNNAYHGSVMHFFRSLWADDLTDQEFLVRDQEGNFLSYEDIVFNEDEQKYLRHQGD
jgi:hypothetical protein